MQSQIPLRSDAVRRLRRDHVELDRRGAALREHADDAEELKGLWEDFARDLDAHLAFEEHDVFPALAREAPDGRLLVERLHGQHALITRRLEELGAEIRRGTARAEAIEAFVDALAHHTELEDAQVYPWLAARA